MLKKISFAVAGAKSEQCKIKIETEIGVLPGIKDVVVNHKTGDCQVEYENEMTSTQKISSSIEKLGYRVTKTTSPEKQGVKERLLFVEGMHCASCEVIIEKRLLQEKEIKSVEATAGKGEVLIEYEGSCPEIKKLNNIFKSNDYAFSDHPKKNKKKSTLISSSKDGELIINKQKLKNFFIIFTVSITFIVGFIFLHKSGLSAIVSVNAKSALPMFILFGLVAGFSSCAALVGGIVLSMSKQWSELYANDESDFKKFQPHILFNVGRFISYLALGAVLGGIGGVFKFSTNFSSMLVVLVSIMMLFLGLQMLGVKYFQKFQVAMPKFITRYIADESNFAGKYMPIVMGALTFFLPCGFTITAQGLALASGDMLQGSLIMGFFALGTLPALAAIGFSSITFTKNPRSAGIFLKIAGILVLFFAIFNINAQLNVLGFSSLDDIEFSAGNNMANASEEGLPEIINGKQVLKMDAMAYGYEPNKLKVRVGVPVRWEITDKGTSGCTNAVISQGLFDGQISLTPGQVSVKEFTPKKTGRYKFSCWMGMVSGTIDVIDSSASGNSAPPADTTIIESGAKGCGCGGSGGGSDTCGG